MLFPYKKKDIFGQKLIYLTYVPKKYYGRRDALGQKHLENSEQIQITVKGKEISIRRPLLSKFAFAPLKKGGPMVLCPFVPFSHEWIQCDGAYGLCLRESCKGASLSRNAQGRSIPIVKGRHNIDLKSLEYTGKAWYYKTAYVYTTCLEIRCKMKSKKQLYKYLLKKDIVCWKSLDKTRLETLGKNKWTKSVERMLLQGYIKPGMTTDMLMASLGSPKHIKKGYDPKKGAYEIYYYRYGRYNGKTLSLSMQGGKLVSWEEE